MFNRGILLAVDEKLEWLLPWWWNKYSAHNTLPVAFIDFGLSHYGRSYCRERGEIIDFREDLFLGSSTSHAKKGEILFGKNLWTNRKSWVKKPLAFLATPFERTLWIDIDCEVLTSLDSLFEREGEIYLAKETEPSIARDRMLKNIADDEILYSSGVVLYHKDSPLIEKWAKAVMQQGDHFWSDQHALSRVIHRGQYPIHLLEPEYNWRMSQGFNIHASIILLGGELGQRLHPPLWRHRRRTGRPT
ncbi:MAG: hypothetical protein KR126chlam3_01220 [Chlamydiae bacterium]|nr:hypothetical protein [Chlamydiota bacterium]